MGGLLPGAGSVAIISAACSVGYQPGRYARQVHVHQWPPWTGGPPRKTIPGRGRPSGSHDSRARVLACCPVRSLGFGSPKCAGPSGPHRRLSRSACGSPRRDAGTATACHSASMSAQARSYPSRSPIARPRSNAARSRSAHKASQRSRSSLRSTSARTSAAVGPVMLSPRPDPGSHSCGGHAGVRRERRGAGLAPAPMHAGRRSTTRRRGRPEAQRREDQLPARGASACGPLRAVRAAHHRGKPPGRSRRLLTRQAVYPRHDDAHLVAAGDSADSVGVILVLYPAERRAAAAEATAGEPPLSPATRGLEQRHAHRRGAAPSAPYTDRRHGPFGWGLVCAGGRFLSYWAVIRVVTGWPPDLVSDHGTDTSRTCVRLETSAIGVGPASWASCASGPPSGRAVP